MPIGPMLSQSSRQPYHTQGCSGASGTDIETRAELPISDGAVGFWFDRGTNELHPTSSWRFGKNDTAFVWGDIPDCETALGFYGSHCATCRCQATDSAYELGPGESRDLLSSNAPWGSYAIRMRNTADGSIALFRHARQWGCRCSFRLIVDDDLDGDFSGADAPDWDDGIDDDAVQGIDYLADPDCASPLDPSGAS